MRISALGLIRPSLAGVSMRTWLPRGCRVIEYRSSQAGRQFRVLHAQRADVRVPNEVSVEIAAPGLPAQFTIDEQISSTILNNRMRECVWFVCWLTCRPWLGAVAYQWHAALLTSQHRATVAKAYTGSAPRQAHRLQMSNQTPHRVPHAFGLFDCIAHGAAIAVQVGPKGMEFARYSIDYHYIRNYIQVRYS